MLADRHQHFAGHVSTLLRSWCLVFDVDTVSTLCDKQPCQLHNGCEASMASIGISNYRTEEVRICNLSSICFRCRDPFLTLLSVMENLRHKEVLNFVWYSILMYSL